jgi:hypothetical protein
MARESKPIEKLIEEREQERANKYWERIKRLKAQEEEQKKWREAHRQRNLEYMRSAGIDLKKVERDKQEDARNLKSYLEQKRPPLISRPKKTLHFQPPTGWQAPRPTVFGLPPDPSEVHPTNPSQIKIKQVDTGSGWGWSPWPGSATANVAATADVWFTFTPHQDARYTFQAWFAFHGFLAVTAYDDWLTSCSAEVKLTVDLTAFQADEYPKKSFTVIDVYSQNINEIDNQDGVEDFSDTQDFREGQSVFVTAHIEVSAMASGDGSYAELNFEDGEANYIQPLGLWVYPSP